MSTSASRLVADRAIALEAEPAEPADTLAAAIDAASSALLAQQHTDGYWVYELEADATIPAEYIMMRHFMDEVDPAIEARIAVYLRDHQLADGGWPLYQDGEAEISCTVKAYYGLKLAGDSPDAPHMVRAREWILARGGASRCNVFTRIALALFGQIPWRGVPFVPVEVMLFPRWFPFHLSKVSYWSRAVMVPLLILCSLKPQAANPRGIDVQELFVTPPDQEKNYFPVKSGLNGLLLWLDRLGRALEPLIPGRLRRYAIRKAESWMTERLNGQGGLGAIFPAMVNAYEALACLGYPSDHPARRMAGQALEGLLVTGERAVYCQPCVSPVWDTTLALLAVNELDERPRHAEHLAFAWLRSRQLLEAPGDWRKYRPELPGGGWPFQFENGHYPDLDDTAAVAWAMQAMAPEQNVDAIRRACDWLVGMQSKNGGFAAFDADNTYYYLNEIPFADHGALLDPPTADVTGRCVTILARVSEQDPRYRRALEAALQYLRGEQESHGAWYGRWGTNYIYGTWSVLTALEAAGATPDDPAVSRAVEWLKSVQRGDGSWGEDNYTYEIPDRAGRADTGTSFQTAWAMLALMAGGAAGSEAARKGHAYLLATQQDDGLWEDAMYTAPGFPRVFYLKYHGYSKYFPLWALARYRKLTNADSR